MDNQNNPNLPNNPTYPPAGSPPDNSTTSPAWPTAAPLDPTPLSSNTPISPAWPTADQKPLPSNDPWPPPSGSISASSAPAPTTGSDNTGATPTSNAWPPAPQTDSFNTPTSAWPTPAAESDFNPIGSESTLPMPEPNPLQSEPTPTPTQSEPPSDAALPQEQTSTWTPPAQSEPTQTPAQSESTPSPAEPVPTFTPSVPDQPIPTAEPSQSMTEPAPNTTDAAPPEPTSSPLDNPWGSPPQAPPLDQPQPATQPSWTSSEAAPTDLSHLISNNQPEQATPSASETLVAPATAPVAPEVPNLPTEAHKGIPKWLIGLGGGLLLLVVGASAYFILGVGQPTKTTSLPATTAPETTEVKLPPPIATPAAQFSEQLVASESANFGQLGGNGVTQSPSPNSATSAAELLRQRQRQQGI